MLNLPLATALSFNRWADPFVVSAAMSAAAATALIMFLFIAFITLPPWLFIRSSRRIIMVTEQRLWDAVRGDNQHIGWEVRTACHALQNKRDMTDKEPANAHQYWLPGKHWM